jgi:hypothetical protein
MSEHHSIQMNGHEYIPLSHAAKLAGITKGYAKEDADRAGLPTITLDRGSGKLFHYVEMGEARKFAELVRAQRSDGRRRGFGFTYPSPGKTKRHGFAAVDVDPRIDVPATLAEPAPTNALTVAQVAALQARVDSMQVAIDSVNTRTMAIEDMLAAILRELNIKV